ncbi:YidB family protein [Falsiroseomonas sp.]|uniref:YidB family protein n=1 Tax=Falsiroseomonas sp. TaxID=2870721 RepID=UPI0027259668|nr:YidB family protein [Falsiroseomonas sp.]MDO9501166.1 YidB family protein [Falsiroseomonas sp.]
MSRGFPSMTALLGVLAVAGYQNREKLSEMLNGAMGQRGASPAGTGSGAPGQAGQGGLQGMLGGLLGGGAASGGLSGGLRDLLARFRDAGEGETAESWVRQGPNQDLAPDRLERAIGAETLDELTRQTGLSRQELLARLARDLPKTVDDCTPGGCLPDEEPARRA